MPVSFLEAPENPAARTPRRWLAPLVITAAMLAVPVAGVAYYLGWWGGYEHRLTASVGHLDCRSVSTSDEAWGGDDLRALDEGAGSRFSAACEKEGPTVMWLRFASRSDLRRALASTPTGPRTTFEYSTVCISEKRAEVVLFDGVSRRRSANLCAARDGRIVHRESE
jgi:hypothetical protein